MERVKKYSKVAAIISLLLIPVAILFDCGGRGAQWPLLTLLAPVALLILLLCFFYLLNKADKSFRTAAVWGISACSIQLLSKLLTIVAFLLYNYFHKSNVGVSMASGVLIYVFYILLLGAFLYLQDRFKKQPLLRSITILFPLVLIGLFAYGLVNVASVQAPLNEYLRATVPYLMSAVFFFVYSISKSNTIAP